MKTSTVECEKPRLLWEQMIIDVFIRQTFSFSSATFSAVFNRASSPSTTLCLAAARAASFSSRLAVERMMMMMMMMSEVDAGATFRMNWHIDSEECAPTTAVYIDAYPRKWLLNTTTHSPMQIAFRELKCNVAVFSLATASACISRRLTP